MPTDEQQEQLKQAEVQFQQAQQEFQQAVSEHVEDVLQKCSQDEIIAELRRRHWHGTLHITTTIEL
jgi:predicted transcriptional regulator